MRVIIDEDLEAYRSGVRRFMDNVLRPLLAGYDLTRPLTRGDLAAIRRAVQAHEIARSAPEGPDGTVDLLAAGIFTEEINRVDASIGSVAAAVFFPLNDMIRKVFGEEQVARYPHLLEPGRMIAISTSEPDTGSDASGIKTTAVLDGDHWVVNGRKLRTSNGAVADALLVSCKIKDREGETALFVVDLEEHPLEIREVPVIGMNGVSTCEVVYDNVVLPKEACIGRLGTLGLISYNRVTIALSSVGIAYRALALLQAGRPARAEAATAKWWCTEMAQRVTSVAIQKLMIGRELLGISALA